jgi:hypothetical protein
MVCPRITEEIIDEEGGICRRESLSNTKHGRYPFYHNAKLLQDLNFYFDKDKCHILKCFAGPAHPSGCRNGIWAIGTC